MKRFTSAFALLTGISLTFAACGGDDDDDSGGKAGSSNAGTSSNTAGTSSNTGEGGGAPTDGNVPCDPDSGTTCQNETDCPFVVDGRARTAAQTCGKGECLGSSDENCARDCILEELDMTGECASCYADLVKCTITNCLAECVADPNSSGCFECQATSGCRPTFDECSGLGE